MRIKYQISNADKQDYPALIDVWEQSVRATHNFLPEGHIVQLKSLIIERYFDGVHLKCIKNKKDKIIGFSGVAEDKLEMLFVTPHAQGQGVGSALCNYAIASQKITKVDVNEQNPDARKFYEKMGFTVSSRSALDGQGNPYPVLHMEKG